MSHHTEDLASLVTNVLDATWNSHDVDRVMDLYADDAVFIVTPAPPGFPPVSRGKEEIRRLVEALIPGFNARSYNFRNAGESETWESTLDADFFTQAGIGPATCTTKAVIQDGKVKTFDVTFSPETVAKLEAVLQSMAGAQ